MDPTHREIFFDAMTAGICFGEDLVAVFAIASHDGNPLHTSRTYARATPFGDPLVHGVLAALASLSRVSKRPEMSLSRLELGFRSPIYTGIEYGIRRDALPVSTETVALFDGSDIALRATATFEPGPRARPVGRCSQILFGDISARSDPIVREMGDFTTPISVSGSYSPAWNAVDTLTNRLGLSEAVVPDDRLAVLLLVSYVVGMELPGRSALLQEVALTFPMTTYRPTPLSYEAHTVRFDQRFGLLEIELEVTQDDAVVASASVRTLVLPAATDPLDDVTQRPDDLDLTGRVALVIGASRGLGAAIAYGLVRHGGTVLASYHHSDDHAARLLRESERAAGTLVPIRGDASDPDTATRVRADLVSRWGGQLDIAVFNAAPPVRPLRLEAAHVDRITAHVATSVALVAGPLAAFLELVAARSGRIIVVSSSAVTAPKPTWPHHVAAKCAVEGLVRTAAVSAPAVAFLIIRPPPMATDALNTTSARLARLVRPSRVAAAVLDWLAAPAAPGTVTVLDDFDVAT